MDAQQIQTYLTGIRAAGDAAMRPCQLISPALDKIPPQRVGIAHLFLRPRFILADPTGCGKTPMGLAAFAYIREKDPKLRLLVATKKSAQFQWKSAVARFLPSLTAEVIGFDPKTKRRLTPAERKRRIEISQADVLITTPSTLALDEATILQYVDHYILVLDEVHGISNFHTMREEGTSLYASALRASVKARGCWGLSATPLENDNLDEVFSLMELVRPGTFGDVKLDVAQRYKTFRRNYYVLELIKPKWKPKKVHHPGCKCLRCSPRPYYEIRGTQNLDHLRATIDPFYLRRPKHDFDKYLPALEIRVDDVWLEAKQRKLYDEIIKQRWPGRDGEKMIKIAALTYAQQALAFPELVGHPEIPSAKWEALKGLLQGELKGEKVIVYSKSVEVLKILSRELTTLKIVHTRVTGLDSAPQRDASRHRFQTDPKVPVMLVSDAGGEALNLQAAGYVVFYDLPWTHGAFLQILGRAHRLGSRQSRVLAILLGATHSYDESMLQLLIRKETVIRDIIRQGNSDTDTLLSDLTPTETDSPDSDYSALFDLVGGPPGPPTSFSSREGEEK